MDKLFNKGHTIHKGSFGIPHSSIRIKLDGIIKCYSFDDFNETGFN